MQQPYTGINESHLVTVQDTDSEDSDGSIEEAALENLGIRKASAFDQDSDEELDQEQKIHRNKAIKDYVIRTTHT